MTKQPAQMHPRKFMIKPGSYAYYVLIREYMSGGNRSYDLVTYVKVLEHRIYNHDNKRYVVQDIQTKKLYEVDKKYFEEKAKVGNLKTLQVLYGNKE